MCVNSFMSQRKGPVHVTLSLVGGAVALAVVALVIHGATRDAAPDPAPPHAGRPTAKPTPTPVAQPPPSPPAEPPTVTPPRPPLVTRTLRARAVCTRRACPGRSCCNSCGFRGWSSGPVNARGEHKSLPPCRVDGCGRCNFTLKARGYRRGDRFVAVSWTRRPSGATPRAAPGVWVAISPPTQRRAPVVRGGAAAVRRFFRARGIAVHDVRITTRSTCRALRCPASRRVEIKVDAKDRPRVTRLLPWVRSSNITLR